MANLNLNNIHIQEVEATDKWLKSFFKRVGIEYSNTTKILKLSGPTFWENELKYIGSDDKVGPNYTGQAAVCSVYKYK